MFGEFGDGRVVRAIFTMSVMFTVQVPRALVEFVFFNKHFNEEWAK